MQHVRFVKTNAEFRSLWRVELNNDAYCKNFKEKQFYETGDINGGIYLLNIEQFLDKDFPENFLLKKITWKNITPKRKCLAC